MTPWDDLNEEQRKSKFHHAAMPGEGVASIVQGRQAFTLCGFGITPSTFQGDFVADKPECPRCAEITDRMGATTRYRHSLEDS